ncbi:ABC transporter substrate-binding protein [Paenibacillus caseinilyticus]|uniref:ABC transporter substrate-binding protein n=2 Tax=Paenibacillus mucilaginosus TaxID=61624 RepID=I0BEK3_9BACL|nr:extracellular solute-binding protein [Paenibacillus mucilaginosus]AFH60800.1 ABC transporter substrate-binding protein [Paenibacillus mucilaginosus K02]
MRSSMWKKSTALLALSALLSACSGGNGGGEAAGGSTDAGSTAAKKVKLSLLSWNNEQEMAPVLEGFKKKYPNVTIDFQHAPPVKDYIAKLQTMLLSGSATDIFIIAAENRNEIIDGGYAIDLTDQPFMDKMLDSNKPMLSKNGRTYAFTQTGWAGGIFYNKELFQKAGIDKPPATWDEFIAACLKLKNAGIVPLYDNLQDVTMIHNGLYANMTLAKDPDIDKKIFEGTKTFQDGWLEPFNVWKKGLIDNKIITPDMIGLTADQIVNEFAIGSVAMFQGGPWSIATIEQANPNLKYDMMPIPGVNPGDNYYSGAPGVGFAVNSKTKYKEEALAFVEYLSTPEGLQLFEKGTRAFITAKGYESKVHPVMEGAYKDGLLKGKFYLPMVAWPRHQEALRNQFTIAVQDMVVGKMTPEQVAKSLDSKLQEMEKK